MPDPDSGKQCTVVPPTKPKAADEADNADPGQVEQVKAGQQETQTGKYGSVQAKSHTKNEENKDKTHWIEIELVDDVGEPVAGESIEVECPDGSLAHCSTDEKGVARVEYLDPGTCKITFVHLDKEAVEEA